MSGSVEHMGVLCIFPRPRARRERGRGGRLNGGTFGGEFRSLGEVPPQGGKILPRAPPPPVRPPPKPPRRYRLNNAPIQRNERPRVTMEMARKTITTTATAFQSSTRREGSGFADPPSYLETISLPAT